MALSVEHFRRSYGTFTAVDDLSFEVRSGEIVGLIGPNGAGKTTALNAIAGFILPTTGEIRFEDRDITRQRADQICRLGLGRSRLRRSCHQGRARHDNGGDKGDETPPYGRRIEITHGHSFSERLALLGTIRQRYS